MRKLKLISSIIITILLILCILNVSVFATELDFDGNFSFDIEDRNISSFSLDTEETYHNCEILGVQSNSKNTDKVRFVSVVESDILKAATDYGYMFYKLDKKDTTEDIKNIRKNLDDHISAEKLYKKYSCKGTVNTIVSGGYENNVFEPSQKGYTRYKYLSSTVNGVSDDKYLIAKFYIEVNGKYHYATYNGNFKACVFSAGELSNAIKSKIEIVGHRGAMDIAPENTLVSFEQAAGYGYPAVETDYWITKSNDILCLHNENLLKCGFPELSIKDIDINTRYDYPVINDANASKYETQYIPTIEEVIKKVASLDMKLFLHTKDKNTSDEKIEEIITLLKKYGIKDRTIFVSSNKECCIRLSKHDCIACFLVVTPTDSSMEAGMKLCVDNKVPYFMVKYISGYPTSENIKKAHSLNLTIGVYNANNISKIMWLVDNDCDYAVVNNWI